MLKIALIWRVAIVTSQKKNENFSKQPINKNLIAILGSVIAVIAIIITIVLIFNIFRKDVRERPVVSKLNMEDNVLTVEGGKPGETLYCVTTEKKSKTCEWQNYNNFTLAEEATYYIFIKSTENGKISKPSVFKYRNINYDDMRM